jgi:hypothetical protein
MMRRLACFVAVMLSATACTGESATVSRLTTQEQKAVANLKRGIDGSWGVSPQASTCMATELVDKLGIEKLKRIGYLRNDLSFYDSSRDMSKPDANAFVDVELGCMGYKAIVAAMVAPHAPDSDPYVMRCTRVVTEDDVHVYLVAAFSGGHFLTTPLYRKMTRANCPLQGD